MVDAKKSPVSVAGKWCKGCGICIEFCPKKVLDFDSKGKSYVKNPEDCNKCQQCELRCPDFAIVVKKGEKDNE
ncbi:4Fe-4S dicluster domain-containing protein [Natranaerofaba carboxydovora]|uniref:4Fe-4S dicluster domain-containing protein n=1 Tax=Natranaerofaba carboxydovora TaxID=2742683 RepID=UPI001F12BCE5|nr:4Fe-4S dicluster domain-containing protein [Natranaerofaba carboxydovora]UMZ73484.1 4Fe-4S dicluster domain protein [Natranaerofaba carboxydovora]